MGKAAKSAKIYFSKLGDTFSPISTANNKFNMPEKKTKLSQSAKTCLPIENLMGLSTIKLLLYRMNTHKTNKKQKIATDEGSARCMCWPCERCRLPIGRGCPLLMPQLHPGSSSNLTFLFAFRDK